MTSAPTTATGNESPVTSTGRYRLPGIEREGIAQLSLLETALWPLQGGKLPADTFQTAYAFTTPAGKSQASVIVRAPLGLQPVDELVLWGLLGATLDWKDPDPVLHATPYWLLRHLGLETGGYQYTELRESLVRLAVTSYHNTAFYNPLTREREYVAFQFLSILLPTVGGGGESVDTDRAWRVEWNPAFFRLCQATGGNLLFDLDLYRRLTPASRRLFLKLKDRFWRSKRVFMNVDDLTINGLGFAPQRPLKKRKYDLKNCLRELLDLRIIMLGRGQTDPEELFMRRGKGCYVVSFYEGEYFRQPITERSLSRKNALTDDPLQEPLRQIGVDGPAIRRLLTKQSRNLIQRWLRITEAGMHEQPRGFGGFKVSPAAFLIDGIQNRRTPPDWFHAHEKRREQRQWEEEHARHVTDEATHQQRYQDERATALQSYLASAEGKAKYEHARACYRALYRLTDPDRMEEAAHEAAVARIDRLDFAFPDFARWVMAMGQSDAKPEEGNRP